MLKINQNKNKKRFSECEFVVYTYINIVCIYIQLQVLLTGELFIFSLYKKLYISADLNKITGNKMPKTMISLRIDASLYELLKQKNINVSGLVETLLKDYIVKNTSASEQQQADVSERVQFCQEQFKWASFRAMESDYVKRVIWHGLEKRGYTQAEIQVGWERALADYEQFKKMPTTNEQITLLKGTPTDWQNDNDNDNNKNTNDVNNVDE